MLAYGDFITNVIQFLIVAAALFLVIKAMNSMKQASARRGRRAPAAERRSRAADQIRDALAKR